MPPQESTEPPLSRSIPAGVVYAAAAGVNRTTAEQVYTATGVHRTQAYTTAEPITGHV
jgi:hypothetical protein